MPPGSAAHLSDRRKWWLAAGAGAIVLALLGWWLFGYLTSEEPRLNDNAVVLTRFIHSRSFEKLPYDKQRQFYKVLDDRDQEIDQAFRDKRLSESEYRSALEAAWLGKHINRVEKYYSIPPGQGRVQYIHKLLDKKEKKKPDGANEIKADETAAEMVVANWPPSVRQQWETFHGEYRKEKKARQPTTAP